MGLSTCRARVTPGDAPGGNHAHEPSPPRFTLVRGETLIALVPDDEDSASSLVVTREGPGRLRLEPREKARALIADAPRVSSRAVYGCAGAVRTPSGVHLLVISRCVCVGVVRGCRVFRAAAVDAVSCASPGASRALSRADRRDERKRLRLLRNALDPKTTFLFLSGDPARYDATRSRARRDATPPRPDAAGRDDATTTDPRVNLVCRGGSASSSPSPWFAADRAFVWNARCGDAFLAETTRSPRRLEGGEKNDDNETNAASAFLAPLARGSWRSATVAVRAGSDRDPRARSAVAVVSVVARVARARHGVRHHCRGADADGNVANFVETEQMCETRTEGAGDSAGTAAGTETPPSRASASGAKKSAASAFPSRVSSFVIARGSAPLRWAQPLRDVRWRFPLEILEERARRTDGDERSGDGDGGAMRNVSASVASARAHFAAFARTYGASTALDLLRQDPASSESRLSAALAAAASDADARVRLVSFDLAREVARRGDREAARLLLRETEVDAERHGFWFEDGSCGDASSVAKTDRSEGALATTSRAQTGAFRVNCKDCLDRTNVAQTALAFRALLKQALCCAFGGDVSPHVAIANETQQRLRKVHGALWSAHGDDVARLYARTRALRRDVTGSGRRSFLGALADARVAVARWWQSKFSDGEAQDAARYFTSGGELGGDPGRGGGLGFAPGERGEEAKERKERRARRGRGRFGASLSCLRLNQPEAVHADDAWALEVPRAKRREKTRRVAPAPARANERGDLER